jgi:DNA replication protein DnaC
MEPRGELIVYLKELKAPTMRACYEEVGRMAERESLSYAEYLRELVERECLARRMKRVDRLLKESRLPREKTFSTLEMNRLPPKVKQQLATLRDGTFLDRKENVLVFGAPGTGKTHVVCALGQELIRSGRRVYGTPCSLLVQDLLIAKQSLQLRKAIKRLSYYDALIIDDIGYVQQSREEMEVLFTLLAERYERSSILLTSNLPFSKWEAIFKDPLTTAAAIDRLVHHSIILELNISSYRMEHAPKKS